MAISKKWLDMVKKKFLKSSHPDATLPNTKINPRPSSSEETASFEKDTSAASQKNNLAKEEDAAAIKIQAYFRGYLARRAFQAPTQSVVVTSSRSKGMGKTQNCFKMVERKLRKSSRANNRARSSSKEATGTKSMIHSINVRLRFRARQSIARRSKKKKLRMSPSCFGMVQRKFHRKSNRNTISPHVNNKQCSSTKEAVAKEETINTIDPNEATDSLSVPSSRKEEFPSQEHAAAIKIQAIFRGHRARRAFQRLKNLVSRSMKKENTRRTMRMPQKLFNRVRRKFRKTSHRDLVFPHTNICARSSTDVTDQETINGHEELTEEDHAAIKIQACFRGHLARRAFRALKSLVKLQAVVRGVCVRRQARIAMHCMHALARLQVRVRARQLLNGEDLSCDD